MYTEKEAQVKLCPKLLDAQKARQDQLCQGVACMAWRWNEVMHVGPDSYQSEPGPEGYCGLAGLPDLPLT